MKHFYVLFVSIITLFVLTACSSTNQSESVTSQNTQASEVSSNEEKNQSTETSSTQKESAYQEETRPTGYLIQAEQVFLGDNTEGLLTLDFHRMEENDSLEQNFMQSLVESDGTSQNVLSELEEVSIENNSEATLIFSPDEMLSSLSSTEQSNFDDMLVQISALYGIEQLHFYVGDEPGIDYGQSGTVATKEVETIENRGYYLFPTEETENPEYNYITGASSGEEVHDENGELLNFEDTLEAMRSVTAENVARKPSINEDVDIHSATIEGEKAEVNYSISEKQDWTEEKQEQLEEVLQLTALDFDVDELQLTNETEKTHTIFPFK